MMATLEPTLRFSGRVADYTRHRPSYPAAALDWLAAECGLRPGAVVADVGSGTGIFAELLLERGAVVAAVEPNAAMRAAAGARLGARAGFRSVAGTAEDTGLAAASVDLVTAAQAFHWFDRVAARREFARILRPGGFAVLVWNHRRSAGDPFHEGLEALIRRHGTDYDAVRRAAPTEADLNAFFAPTTMTSLAVEHRQVLDAEGLVGRVASSSFAPARGTAAFAAMEQDLRRLFGRHARAGRIALHHTTRLHSGRIGYPA